jgi:hypothetical protein
MHVTIINRGRRPVLLRMIGGESGDGDWSGSYFEGSNSALRLGEHERHELTIDRENGMLVHPDGPVKPFVRMWVEDSLGNRHPIPNSREYLAKLHA